MSWTDRFNFPTWNLVSVCVIIGALLLWEMWGVFHTYDATLTYFVRNTLPKWVILLVLLILADHFVWHNALWKLETYRTALSWLNRIN